MKRYNILVAVGVLMLSIAVLLMGCGGGGGDTSRSGGSDASLSASNAPQVGDTVIQAARLVTPTTALGEVKAGSVSSQGPAPLMSIFKGIAPFVERQAVNEKRPSSISSEPCPNGGSIEVGTPVPVSLDHVKADVTVNECKIGTETMNGSLEVTVPTSALSDLQHVNEFTIEVSSFTYSDPHTNTNLSLTDNFTMVAKDIRYSGDSLTRGSLTLGGTISGTINGEAIDVQCDSFKLQFSAGQSGVSVWVSGRIKASCLGGWVAMTTNAPVFLPVNADCPTGGEIIASAGGSSVKIAISGDKSIRIYFNSTLIQSYPDCSGVEGLCM